LHQTFYEHKDVKAKDYRVIEGTILPGLPQSYYDRLDALRGVYRDRYRDGLWTAYEGLVYPYDPLKNLVSIDDVPFSQEGDYYLGIDFGTDHPFSCQFWFKSPSDYWYMYREVYYSQRTARHHAPLIIQGCEKDGIEVPTIICDHDAEGIDTLREEFKKAMREKDCPIRNVRFIKAIKDRLDGQQAVYNLFEDERIFFVENALVERDQRLEMEGKPTCTVEEFAGHIWSGKTKEEWVKRDDHGMDTMRYVVYTVKRGMRGSGKLPPIGSALPRHFQRR
jgi:phage terminase large subunit